MSLSNNICLIGGNGFLGNSFRKLYGKTFDKVIIFGRKEAIDGLADNEHYYSIAGLTVAAIASILARESVKIVVDFAYNTIPKTSFDNPIADFSENLLSINQYLEAAIKNTGLKYIYISSGGTVYGNTAEHEPIKEEHGNVPLSPYGITKLTCERYVLMYKEIYGLNACIVRPANIYGPGQQPFRGQGFIATAMAKVLQGGPVLIFGDGEQVRDNVYINDFCAALHDIALYGATGSIYNVGSGTGYSINEVFEKIEAALGNVTVEKQYQESRPFDVQFNVLNCAKLQQLQGWEIKTDFGAGLEETKKWIVDYLQTNPL